MKNFKISEHKIMLIDFYINVDKTLFFHELDEGWDDIIIDGNRLIVKVTMKYGYLGVEGRFSIGIPPVNEDVTDAWNYCRKAGLWDWYTAYSYILKINDYENENYDLQIFTIINSLFETSPYFIMKEFNLNKYNDLNYNLLISDSNEHDGEIEQVFENTLIEFMKILKIEFDAELVEKPKDQII
jgi:hypothetical protein